MTLAAVAGRRYLEAALPSPRLRPWREFCYHRRVRLRLLSTCLLGIGACGLRAPEQASPAAAAPDLGAVVARVGDVPVYGTQVLAEAKRSGKAPRQAAADLVTFHLLAKRARQDGYAPPPPSDPEVTSALVQRFVERELEPQLRPEAIPDDALRPLYEHAKDTFVHPRLVEVGVLAIYTGPLMKPEPREERRLAAHALAAHLEEHPPKTLDEFKAVASDPAWSSRYVVYFRITQSPTKPLAPKLGADIVKLRAPGETTQLLSDETGFYVARYVGERPPSNTPFEQAREALRAAYRERWQKQRYQALTAELMKNHRVEAFFERLSGNEPAP